MIKKNKNLFQIFKEFDPFLQFVLCLYLIVFILFIIAVLFVIFNHISSNPSITIYENVCEMKRTIINDTLVECSYDEGKYVIIENNSKKYMCDQVERTEICTQKEVNEIPVIKKHIINYDDGSVSTSYAYLIKECDSNITIEWNPEGTEIVSERDEFEYISKSYLQENPEWLDDNCLRRFNCCSPFGCEIVEKDCDCQIDEEHCELINYKCGNYEVEVQR